MNDEEGGAYYNVALCFLRSGDKSAACSYAYKAGKVYIGQGNKQQATKMVLFIKHVDPGSSLVQRLNKEIADASN